MLRYIACVKYCTMNKGSNAMYVEGVESSSIYTIKAVMLCMSKVLKEVQVLLHIFVHNFLNLYHADQILPILCCVPSVTKVTLLHFIHALPSVTKVSAIIVPQKFCNFACIFNIVKLL